MIAASARKKSSRPVRAGATTRDPVRTREALRQAAFDEMHRSGFRGADVETILRKAGVTKGALYHHFDGKDALGYAVVDDVIAPIMRAKWQLPLQEARNAVDALIAIVRSTSLLPEHVICGCPLNSLSEEMSRLDEGFRKRTATVFRAWHRSVAAALRDGKARGTVRNDIDPNETATFLIAAYEGTLSLAKNSQDAGVLRAGLTTLVRYLETLRPQGRGRRRTA
jgi:TetR/AcrR family transcriptional regulator, transcriptional repressor for nem operon